MNALLGIIVIAFIFSIGMLVYTVFDTIDMLINDESPFNLVEKDVDLFDREDR